MSKSKADSVSWRFVPQVLNSFEKFASRFFMYIGILYYLGL